MPKTLLDLQREKRDEIVAAANAATALAETEDRVLTPEESELVVRSVSEAAEITTTIEATVALARGNASATTQLPVARNIRVGAEPQTYTERGDHSHLRDVMNARINNDTAAWDRLHRHGAEVMVEKRDLTRVDGAGGEFVPPLWLLDLYGPFPRAERSIANLPTQMQLPNGTDSINIPLITTGPQVAPQTADNGAVQETDMVSSSVAVPVRTIVGQQDLAIQLIDQSPLGAGMDALIYGQLAADYERQLGTQIWFGSGVSGQVTGYMLTSGINSVSYTDASPTVPELYLPLAQGTSKVHTTAFVEAEAIVMTPRRWNWMLSALDSSNRPLVVPTAQGPYMALGNQERSAAKGPVGSVLGLPVFLDATGPLTLTAGVGAAGTEDSILIAKFSDSLLMEGSVNTRVLPDVGSGTLTVRFQYYRYVAFTAGRRVTSVSKVVGTGLAAPSGF